jgi:hypothetical protein
MLCKCHEIKPPKSKAMISANCVGETSFAAKNTAIIGTNMITRDLPFI